MSRTLRSFTRHRPKPTNFTLVVLGISLALLFFLSTSLHFTRATSDLPSPQIPEDNLICSDSDPSSRSCYPKFVNPTTEDFVPLLPGQVVDSSLPVHVRMNLETGMKEVKIMSGDGKEGGEVVVATTQDVRAFGSEGEGKSEIKEKVQFHHNETVKNDDSRPKLSLEEKWAFEGFFDAVLDRKDAEEEFLGLLEDLEDTVHHVDYGLQLASSQSALERLVELLKHSDKRIRGQAAVVLGSTFSNNHAAQSKAVESEFTIVAEMVETIGQEKDEMVLKRLLYAVAVLIRGNTKGSQQFIEAGGLGALAVAADVEADIFGVISKRALNLLADLSESTEYATGEHKDRLCERWRRLVGGDADAELARRLEPVCSAVPAREEL